MVNGELVYYKTGLSFSSTRARVDSEIGSPPPMKPPKRYPEIFVDKEFLSVRGDIIYQVAKVNTNTYRVILEHPVFGRTMEIFEEDGDGDLCLKSVFPMEMHDEIEEIESVKSYYNDYLLGGEESYLEYFNPEVGHFLLSRNISVYPTLTYKVNDENNE